MDDTDINEAYAAITELNLRLLRLETERDTLKMENQALKTNLQQALLSESMKVHKNKRRLPSTTKERWVFYHQHKSDVMRANPTLCWMDIKKITDQMFYDETSTPQRT